VRVTFPPIETIQPNAHVTIDYELRDEDGDMLEASEGDGGEPIRYVHGYGMLVPGLEAALVGLRAGDQRDVVVPAEAGYGEYDDSLLLEVDRSELPDPKRVAVGDEFIGESADGDEIPMTVVEVDDDTVVVDANHPLAGMTLRYHVKVRDIRAATEDEIKQAAAQLDDAHEHVHGPDCDHDHDDAPIPIGKRTVN
jgi:FKBP-type peptidyl-prolyl cis-trans isomerase SlyD